MLHLNATSIIYSAIRWITSEIAAFFTGFDMWSSPCSAALVTVDKQKNTTDTPPICRSSAGIVLSCVKYKRSRIGRASVIKPAAHGIAMIILKRLTRLILPCISLRVPVWIAATRLGIKEAASALATLKGIFVIVSYCPLNIPRSSVYSFSGTP